MDQKKRNDSAGAKPEYVWDPQKLAWVKKVEQAPEEVSVEPAGREGLEKAEGKQANTGGIEGVLAEGGPNESAVESDALQYKGAWIRAVAFIIDFILLYAVVALFNTYVLGDRTIILRYLIPGLAFVYYFGLWSWRGQTLGKIIIGAKIVKADGSRIGFGRAFLRYIGYMVYFVGAAFAGKSIIVFVVICLLIFAIVAFSRKRRGLHDFIAGTVVINSRPRAPQPETTESADTNGPEPDKRE